MPGFHSDTKEIPMGQLVDGVWQDIWYDTNLPAAVSNVQPLSFAIG